MFIPGETISHRFNLPFPKEGVERIVVSYKQENKTVLVKSVYSGDIFASETTSYFIVTLSQEESLLFKNNMNFTIQLNVIFSSGTRCSSVEMNGENGVQHIRKVVTSHGQ